MYLCKVTGTVVATQKHERLRRSKLLLVRRLGLDGLLLPNTAEEIALDPTCDAGVGDIVLTAKQGTVVQQLMDTDLGPDEPRTPANVIIIAVVDDMAMAE